MAKESDGERGAGKKRVRKASKKAGAKKGRAVADAATATAHACLSMTTAALIVGGCLLPGPHHNDDTLEQTGLITPHLRTIFRECVFNGVHARGCSIERGQIPNDADTEVGEVIDAVFNNAH